MTRWAILRWVCTVGLTVTLTCYALSAWLGCYWHAGGVTKAIGMSDGALYVAWQSIDPPTRIRWYFDSGTNSRGTNPLQWWFDWGRWPAPLSYVVYANVPLWAFVLLLALPRYMAWLAYRRGLHVGACPGCGYALTGLPKYFPCPECGKRRSAACKRTPAG